MTHRQRALAALAGQAPDYVPTFELVFHETQRDFDGRVFYGTPFAPMNDCPLSDAAAREHNARLYIDVARRFEHSVIHVAPIHGKYVRHFGDVVEMIRRIRELSGDEFCVTAPGDPTFKIPGDPMAFATMLYEEPAKLLDAAERDLQAMLPTYAAVRQAGADAIIMTSDYAMNTGPFLCPEHFAQFVAPYLKRAVAAAHAQGLKVIKHSDGDLMPVLDQIIDSGIDALHSIDPMAGMDIKAIKQRYGKRIALCGNVHCAHLQTGTPEQVRRSAQYCLQWAKPGGGYIFSTSNCVFRGMPLDSYDLIHDLWRQHRNY